MNQSIHQVNRNDTDNGINFEDYRNEFLTCHLGYTPLALVDDYVNHFNEPVGGIMDAIEDYFSTILSEQGLVLESEGSYQNEIRQGIHRLQTLLEHLIDKNVDKLEIYLLRNILTLPVELETIPTAFLPHYQDVILNNHIPATFDDEDMLIAELDNKKNELEELRSLNKVLKGKLDEDSKILTGLKGNLNRYGELFENVRNLNDKHLTISTSLKVLNENLINLKDSQPFETKFNYDNANNDRNLYELGRIGYLNWQIQRILKDENVTKVQNDLNKVSNLEKLKSLI